ncbi:MAG: lipopolysaccharide transport periplasmic protein LptA [Epsilonproteobacteria bacterium]|nr:lipopolysaccharide transport periplasmic protein LptA [Campylobacterota bacterium]NPA65128.1 lipopolysaccharide transport periplasmic protein LptA [Campylobacterota bacterium]
MKKALVLVIVACLAMAKQVEITSDSFEASQKELLSKFIGNVTFKTPSERLHAHKVLIYFDKRKKPIKIEAIGDVRFFIKDGQKSFEGKAQKVIYYPKKRSYILLGDVKVVQNPGKKVLFAEEVYLDLKNSKLTVKGKEKKPVKMIFTVEE